METPVQRRSGLAGYVENAGKAGSDKVVSRPLARTQRSMEVSAMVRVKHRRYLDEYRGFSRSDLGRGTGWHGHRGSAEHPLRYGCVRLERILRQRHQ